MEYMKLVLVTAVCLLTCLCFTIHETEALSLARWPPWNICGPTCYNVCECERVYKKGCPTCQCIPCGCPDLECLKFIKCGNGIKIVNGCRTCSCNPPKCQQLFCKKPCPNGSVTINGCPTCICNEPIGLPTVKPCGTKSICPAYVHCPFGYKHDANGCRTCECDTAPLS